MIPVLSFNVFEYLRFFGVKLFNFNAKQIEYGEKEKFSGIPKGLKNVGNTCYFNSVLQAISSCPSMTTHLVHTNAQSCKGSFGYLLMRNLEGIRNSSSSSSFYTSSVNPSELLRRICDANPNFLGRQQQDALELFQTLVELIKEETEVFDENNKMQSLNIVSNRNKFRSPHSFLRGSGLGGGLIDNSLSTNADKLQCVSKTTVDPFQGMMASHLKCMNCMDVYHRSGFKPVKAESFVTIPLAIPQLSITTKMQLAGNSDRIVTVFDCLDDFFKPELLEDISCDACKLANISAYVSMKEKEDCEARRREEYENNTVLDVQASRKHPINSVGAIFGTTTPLSVSLPCNSDKTIVRLQKSVPSSDSVVGIVSPVESPTSSDSLTTSASTSNSPEELEESLVSLLSLSTDSNSSSDINCVAECHSNVNSSNNSFLLASSASPLQYVPRDSVHPWRVMTPSDCFVADPDDPAVKESVGEKSLFTGKSLVYDLLYNNLKASATSAKKRSNNKNNIKDSALPSIVSKYSALKNTAIARLPNILCFNLSRRSLNSVTGSMIKVRDFVSFPVVINMGKYLQPLLGNHDLSAGNAMSRWASNRGGKSASEVAKYLLRAVIVHSGNENSGHYTAYCLLQESPVRKWAHFSDEVVRESEEAEVLGCQAYMLFYDKLNKL